MQPVGEESRDYLSRGGLDLGVYLLRLRLTTWFWVLGKMLLLGYSGFLPILAGRAGDILQRAEKNQFQENTFFLLLLLLLFSAA